MSWPCFCSCLAELTAVVMGSSYSHPARISTPARRSSSSPDSRHLPTLRDIPAPTPSATPEISPENLSVQELQARLDRARADLENTRRQLNETQARIDAANSGRIPQGAVLVIQGLAQTQTMEEGRAANPQHESAADERSRPPSLLHRRSSEGSAHPAQQRRHRGSSLEVQARMISGLLA